MSNPKINLNVKSYFDSHLKTDTFFFVPDETGVPFTDKMQATSHAAALVKQGNKKAIVVPITRGDVEAWWPDEIRKIAEKAFDTYLKAEKAHAEAVEANGKVDPKANAVAKGRAAKLVKDTESALMIADTALEAACKEVFKVYLKIAQEELESCKAGGRQGDVLEAQETISVLEKGGWEKVRNTLEAFAQDMDVNGSDMVETMFKRGSENGADAVPVTPVLPETPIVAENGNQANNEVTTK